MNQNPNRLVYAKTYRDKNKLKIAAYQRIYRERMKQSDPNYAKTYMRQWRTKKKRYEVVLKTLLKLRANNTLTIEAVNEVLSQFQ